MIRTPIYQIEDLIILLPGVLGTVKPVFFFVFFRTTFWVELAAGCVVRVNPTFVCVCECRNVRWMPLICVTTTSGAYNNAGLVSVGGVITTSVAPPPYSSTHKVAGMICWKPTHACLCVCASKWTTLWHAAYLRLSSLMPFYQVKNPLTSGVHWVTRKIHNVVHFSATQCRAVYWTPLF